MPVARSLIVAVLLLVLGLCIDQAVLGYSLSIQLPPDPKRPFSPIAEAPSSYVPPSLRLPTPTTYSHSSYLIASNSQRAASAPMRLSFQPRARFPLRCPTTTARTRASLPTKTNNARRAASSRRSSCMNRFTCIPSTSRAWV
jgi:hypothetical protein